MTNDESIAKFNAGEITAEQLIKELELNLALSFEGTDRSIHVADGKHPLYRNNNNSRDHIAYSYLLTPQGKFYQNVWKKVVLKTVGFLHSSMKKNYDKDIYVYEDPFLIELNQFITDCIIKNFQDMGYGDKYKIPFMMQIRDIILGAINKEDIYYRTRAKVMINALIKKYPNGFELTEAEKRNLRDF